MIYACTMRSRSHRSALIVLGVLAAALGLLVFESRRRRRSRRAGSGSGARPGPVTQAIVPLNPADLDLGMPGRNAERRLEEALQETFPASDPIATHIE
jgi:hypothetical protein